MRCRLPCTLGACVMLCLSALVAHAQDVHGVAFVHGTGSPGDPVADYWQPAIIERVTGVLADPANHTVVTCDFDQYAWEAGAAGCLATQLTSFLDTRRITRLTVITHSHGGNVVRWILSNPSQDSRYPRLVTSIDQVIALAPSSAGTPLADAVINGSSFEVALGWLLGRRSDAVRMQQVTQMAVYNSEQLFGTAGRPALPTPFRVLVGSDVEAAPWDTDSACGGYLLNVGLELTQAWLGPCSDGFLECSSQRAAGAEWFTDIGRTDGAEPLSHAQSRRDCFGLGALLRTQVDASGAR